MPIESLRSVLCSMQWIRDSSTGFYMIFRPDGTGDLQARSEFWHWVAAEFTWRDVTGNLDREVDVPSSAPATSTPLGEADVEITLTDSLIAKLRAARRPIQSNSFYLADAAFGQPRQHHLTVSAGVFNNPIGFQHGPFDFQLEFDPSPYPTREMFREPKKGPDGYKIYEMKDFVGRRTQE